MINKVTEEIKVHTEEDHLVWANEDILSLYEEFKNQILSLDNSIEIVPNKQYIAFKASTNFVDLVPQKEKIKFWLNIKKGVLNDPFNLARDVSKIGHHGNGDYECNLSSSSDFINLMPLVKQSYNQNA